MSADKHAGYGWLLFCAGGMITSLTMYGVVLEYATSGGRKLHEVSFIFVTTSIYALTAYIARYIFQEKRSKSIPKYQMLSISLMSIASAYTSVRSLRYVIYPVQVLFKSCKPVPVMLFGVLLGQKYSFQKYVNVIVITAGVALFMGGGSSASKKSDGSGGGGGADTTLMGALILSISLCFDGATGAFEDKLMSGEHSIGPYDLMFNIQLGKSIISFCALIIVNGVNDFLRTIQDGGLALVILGLTGALGQVFLFITIAKFGALNCALLGLLRKMLSLVLSFFLYGHTLNAVQTVGLALSVAAMGANFYGKSDGHGHGHGGHTGHAGQGKKDGYRDHPGDEENLIDDKHDAEAKDANDDDDNDETPLIVPSSLPPAPPSPRGDIEMNPITTTTSQKHAGRVVEGDLLGLGVTTSAKSHSESLLDISSDSDVSAVVLDRQRQITVSAVPSTSPSSSSPLISGSWRGASSQLELDSNNSPTASPANSPQRLANANIANKDRLIAKALADFVPTKSTTTTTASKGTSNNSNPNPNVSTNGNGNGNGRKSNGGQKQSAPRKTSS